MHGKRLGRATICTVWRGAFRPFRVSHWGTLKHERVKALEMVSLHEGPTWATRPVN